MIAVDAPASFWDAVFTHVNLSNPIVFFFVVLLFSGLTLSKRLAQIKGPLGALARWWSGRQVARVKRDSEIWAVQHKADRVREVAEHKADRARDAVELETLRTDVDWLRRELTDMRRREMLRDRQARDHSQWDNELVRRAQAAGLNIPDPPPLYLNLSPLFVPDE